MVKIEFDSTKDDMSEAFFIPSERLEEIKYRLFESIQIGKNMADPLDSIINADDLDLSEKFFMVYMLGRNTEELV